MTERINGQGFRPVDTAPTRRSEGAKHAESGSDGTAPTAPASSGDTVNLTASGRLLARLEEAVQNAPIVDANRVRATKDALSAGSYQVAGQSVADKMIRLDRELLA